ncbi:MAG: hypothetical protein OXT06_03085 [Rhodospirillaceae bacterium]|nr:hypothetical protein [Rhodospirillaceae bacterium]MDD9913810.1 hypothetical protein [Rhodospirillaceae bacterium]MDD9926533.1 hypothetical protein [Rhodospirillaceae bacterium]
MADPVLGLSVFGAPFLFAQNSTSRSASPNAVTDPLRSGQASQSNAALTSGQNAASLAFPSSTGLPVFSSTLVNSGTVSNATAANFEQAIQNLQRASNLLTATGGQIGLSV